MIVCEESVEIARPPGAVFALQAEKIAHRIRDLRLNRRRRRRLDD